MNTDPVGPITDKETQGQYLLKYKNMLWKLVRRFPKDGASGSDYYQQGSMGLLNALRTYNHSKGSLNSWVWNNIRYYMAGLAVRTYMIGRYGGTSMNRNIGSSCYRFRHGGITVEEVISLINKGTTNIGKEEAEEIINIMSGPDVRLDRATNDTTHGNCIPSSSIVDENNRYEEVERKELLTMFISVIEKVRPELSMVESYVLDNRLLSDEPMTLQEIGEHFNLTRERIRQLECRAIRKLKKATKETGMIPVE